MILTKEWPERNKMEAIVFGLIKQADVIEAEVYRDGMFVEARGVLMVAAETVRSLAIRADVQCDNVVDEVVRMNEKSKEGK